MTWSVKYCTDSGHQPAAARETQGRGIEAAYPSVCARILRLLYRQETQKQEGGRRQGMGTEDERARRQS